jgi:hypothetical protein
VTLKSRTCLSIIKKRCDALGSSKSGYASCYEGWGNEEESKEQGVEKKEGEKNEDRNQPGQANFEQGRIVGSKTEMFRESA